VRTVEAVRLGQTSVSGLPVTRPEGRFRCKLRCMSTGLELIRAGAEHQSALGNLLELYIHDFSELIPIDVGDDGRYGYKSLPLFWSDNSRLPLLARLDGKLVGFVLVTQGLRTVRR
jgi:hypothetical protein